MIAAQFTHIHAKFWSFEYHRGDAVIFQKKKVGHFRRISTLAPSSAETGLTTPIFFVFYPHYIDPKEQSGQVSDKSLEPFGQETISP